MSLNKGPFQHPTTSQFFWQNQLNFYRGVEYVTCAVNVFILKKLSLGKMQRAQVNKYFEYFKNE